ncbi:putative serine carboxypeptidase CPVL isoform X2 [Haemaphysalis longicornis]
MQNSSNGPLLLWLQGGPGLSSLFGQFLEIGPLGMNDQGHLFMRNASLNTRVNVVYLDQPVGAGFSYTKGLLGYAKDLDDVAEGVLEFLRQFLQMFPEYKNREFYVGGESYGARYTVGIAHTFHTTKQPRLPLRLRGVMLGAGFLGDLLKVADSSDFLYQTSMITKKEHDLFAEQFRDMRKKATRLMGKIGALLILMRTIFTDKKKPTLFQTLTGYNNHASALYTEKPLNMLKYEQYVQTDEFKRAVHVGKEVKFEEAKDQLTHHLVQDYLTDISGKIEDLLKWYPVFFYTGQMDTLFPSRNLQDYFRSLNWTGAEEFRKKQPDRWRAYEHSHSASGLITKVGKMMEVVLLGAGHYVAVDKPQEANRMMMMFIQEAEKMFRKN